jgi:hypothetical protein
MWIGIPLCSQEIETEVLESDTAWQSSWNLSSTPTAIVWFVGPIVIDVFAVGKQIITKRLSRRHTGAIFLAQCCATFFAWWCCATFQTRESEKLRNITNWSIFWRTASDVGRHIKCVVTFHRIYLTFRDKTGYKNIRVALRLDRKIRNLPHIRHRNSLAAEVLVNGTKMLTPWEPVVLVHQCSIIVQVCDKTRANELHTIFWRT